MSCQKNEGLGKSSAVYGCIRFISRRAWTLYEILQYFQTSRYTCSRTMNSNLNNCREEVLKDQASGTHALWRLKEHRQVNQNKTER